MTPPPPPLPAVPRVQGSTPQLLPASPPTNMMQSNNISFMTPPPSPAPPRRSLSLSARSFSLADSPGIPEPPSHSPLPSGVSSLLQMGRSDSGYSNSGLDLPLGAPNATRPTPSLPMRRSDSLHSNSDRSVHFLSPSSPRRSPSHNNQDEWLWTSAF